MDTVETSAQELNNAPRRRRRLYAERNQKLHRRLLIITVAAFTVFVLLAGLFIKDRVFSETENRNLAQFPALSAAGLKDGSWSDGVTDWFSDQFPLRDSWITLRSGWQRFTGQKESGQVLFGKDCLLSVPELPDETALENTAAAVNAFAAAHPDIPVSVMVVPGAAAVQSGRLPENAPVRDQLTDVRAFEKALRGVSCIDAAGALLAHSDEYIYYRTDHHWTTLGASYVYAEAAPALGLTAPKFALLPVCGDFRGTLASRSGCGDYSDTVEICALQEDGFYYHVTCGEDGEKRSSLFRSDALETKDKYTVFLGGNYSRVDIQTTAECGRTLLLFKDSYANSFVQFLLPGYDRIIMIDPRYYYGSAESLMNGVTDVLFLYSADTLVRDTSLADVLSAGH